MKLLLTIIAVPALAWVASTVMISVWERRFNDAHHRGV